MESLCTTATVNSDEPVFEGPQLLLVKVKNASGRIGTFINLKSYYVRLYSSYYKHAILTVIISGNPPELFVDFLYVIVGVTFCSFLHI